MLLHEWELRPDPDPDGPTPRDPIDWRGLRWALVAGTAFTAALLTGGTARVVLFWIALIVVVRRAWREIDGVGGLSEHRQ